MCGASFALAGTPGHGRASPSGRLGARGRGLASVTGGRATARLCWLTCTGARTSGAARRPSNRPGSSTRDTLATLGARRYRAITDRTYAVITHPATASGACLTPTSSSRMPLTSRRSSPLRLSERACGLGRSGRSPRALAGRLRCQTFGATTLRKVCGRLARGGGRFNDSCRYQETVLDQDLSERAAWAGPYAVAARRRASPIGAAQVPAAVPTPRPSQLGFVDCVVAFQPPRRAGPTTKGTLPSTPRSRLACS